MELGDIEIVQRSELRRRLISARTEGRRVAAGHWYRPVPGIVATDPCRELQLLLCAALLRAGPGAQVSHSTAAQLWLERPVRGELHLLTTHGNRIRGVPGVRFHQCARLPVPADRAGWPVTPADRTAADVAAGDLPDPDRRALVTGLVQRGWVSPRAVSAAAAATPIRVRSKVRSLVEEVVAGAQSGPEASLWRGQVERRMPMPLLNHQISVTAGSRWLDGYLSPLRAGYEVQGREHHERTWLADTARMAQILVQHGIVLLPIPATRIVAELDTVLDELEGFWRNRAADLQVPLPAFRAPRRWQP